MIISVLNASPCFRCTIFPLKNKHFRFSWSLTKEFTFLKRIKNQFNMLLEICIVQHGQPKSAFTCLPKKILVFTTVKSAKPALMCLIVRLRNKKRQKLYLVEISRIVLQRTRVATTKKKKPSPFLKKIPYQSKSSTPTFTIKGKKSFHLSHKRVDTPLVERIYQNFIRILLLDHFCVQ